MDGFAALAPDLRDAVSEAEWRARVDCAALYRLIAIHGWDDLVFTHVSMRVPGPETHFLINPYGALFDEITASSLVKVDLEGRPVNQTSFPVNPAGFVIHSAIHAARADAHCIIHVHTDAGIAVSAQERGLLPISQTAMAVIGDLAHHDYEGVALEDEERARLVADLGEKHLLMLRSHGTLTMGETPAAAFVRMFYLERACRMQVLAQGGGKLIEWGPDMQARVGEQVKIAFSPMFADAIVWPGLLRLAARRSPGFDR